MALEVAKEAMERWDELEREQERIEEEEERGAKQWVNHDGTPEEDTLEELYLHDILPVALERERLLVTLKLPKLLDNEEIIDEAPAKKETNKEPKDEIK